MKTKSRKAEWATLDQLANRYLRLTEDAADAAERAMLRVQICQHMAGVYLDYLGELPAEADDADAGRDIEKGAERSARLVRRDSLLEKLIKEELVRHTRLGGQRLLQDLHGGTDAFAPTAAQGFIEDRALKKPLKGTRQASFLSAVLHGYGGKGRFEGFMRKCVRHFLADMANARKPLEREARNPERRALLRGEAQPQEESANTHDKEGQPPGQFLDEAARKAAEGHDPWHEQLDRLKEVLAALEPRLDKLDSALLDQLMGVAEEQNGKVLADRFDVTPSAVSQRKRGLVERLRQAMLLDE